MVVSECAVLDGLIRTEFYGQIMGFVPLLLDGLFDGIGRVIGLLLRHFFFGRFTPAHL